MSLPLLDRVFQAVQQLPRAASEQLRGTHADPLMPTIDRLDDAIVLHRDRAISWLVTIVIGALAFTLRIINLSRGGRAEGPMGMRMGLAFDTNAPQSSLSPMHRGSVGRLGFPRRSP